MPWLRIQRDARKKIGVFPRKIKKTAKNLAKLVPKIRKVVQSRDFVSTQTLSTYTQMIDIQPLIKNLERWKIMWFGLKWRKLPNIWTNFRKWYLFYIYELPNDNANLRKSESIFHTMPSSFVCQSSILLTLLLRDLLVSPLADVLGRFTRIGSGQKFWNGSLRLYQHFTDWFHKPLQIQTKNSRTDFVYHFFHCYSIDIISCTDMRRKGQKITQ